MRLIGELANARPFGLHRAALAAAISGLAEQAGRPLSRERLLDRLHKGGAEEAFERSIDVHVSRLRRKLGDPRMLRTVRGEGYMLATPGQD